LPHPEKSEKVPEKLGPAYKYYTYTTYTITISAISIGASWRLGSEIKKKSPVEHYSTIVL